MSSERAQNLAGHFFEFCSEKQSSAHDFPGQRRQASGHCTWFDNFCVLLRRDGHSQLVYKHAISTIMPGHPIQMFEPATKRRPVENKR